jgi:hypothetical protein
MVLDCCRQREVSSCRSITMPTTSLLQLLDAITRKGSEIGVKLVPSGGRTPALHFDFGFKIRSFFHLISHVATTQQARRAGHRLQINDADQGLGTHSGARLL